MVASGIASCHFDGQKSGAAAFALPDRAKYAAPANWMNVGVFVGLMSATLI
jgi:hypothetical protein